MEESFLSRLSKTARRVFWIISIALIPALFVVHYFSLWFAGAIVYVARLAIDVYLVHYYYESIERTLEVVSIVNLTIDGILFYVPLLFYPWN